MKKIATVLATALFTATLFTGTAQARPVPDEPYSGGASVGSKQLCKVNTNWFERHILQSADFKWVRCSSL